MKGKAEVAKAGIVGYGAYVPLFRITVEEIARVWEKDGKSISASLGVNEKAVASYDEDCATISVEAARRAVETAGIDAINIDAIYIGSESHPYAVKPTATIIGDAIGAGPDYMAADLEFACKAGTAGIQMCMGMCMAGMARYGMAIGADTAQGRPGDMLEYTAGSGGAAFVLGGREEEMIARINDTFSFTTDTPDFWRRQHAEFPRHGGRFSGEPAYFRHIVGAAKGLMSRTGEDLKEFDYVVLHQPNGKFPLRAAKILGVENGKIEQGLLAPLIGNTYSGATMLGLASVLDVAKPGEKILAVSYGSGAGSDAFSLTATKNIARKRAKTPVLEMIKEKKYLDYALYTKHRRKLKSL